jgi:hypothetical protein
VLGVTDEGGGDLFRRQDQVDRAGVHRAAGHAVEFCGALTLGDDEAPRLVNRPDPPRAVAAGSGEDDGYRTTTEILGQGPEEGVDGQKEPLGRVAFGELEPPSGDGHLVFGRHEVDGIGLYLHAIVGPAHLELGMGDQELVHQAAEIRGQVLDDDERQLPGPSQPGHEPLQRLEPPGRRPHRDHEPSLGGRSRCRSPHVGRQGADFGCGDPVGR